MWKPCVCCQFCRVVHLHIVSFTEDFFVHASKTLGEFSGNRSQHSAFQKWRSENHVFFWLLAHCRSVSFRKWMKRLVWLYFFISIYIYIPNICESISLGVRPRFCGSFDVFFKTCVDRLQVFLGGVCCIDFPKGFLWIEISWISKTPRCQLGCP